MAHDTEPRNYVERCSSSQRYLVNEYLVNRFLLPNLRSYSSPALVLWTEMPRSKRLNGQFFANTVFLTYTNTFWSGSCASWFVLSTVSSM